MTNIEPYIIFVSIMFFIGLLYTSIKSIEKYEIVIILFASSALIAALFYANEPEWSVEAHETGLGGYLRGLILIFCGILGIAYFFLNSKEHKFKVPLHLLLLFGFCLYNFISIFFSIDQPNTFIRSTLFATVFFFLLGLDSWIRSKNDLNKILNVLFFLVSFFIIANIISIFIIPSRVWWWKVPSRLIGLSSHPNVLGGFTVISFPILLWKFYNIRREWKYFVITMLFLNLVILILTGSRTSFAAVLISLFLWFLIYRDWIKLTAMVSLLIVGALVFSQIEVSSYERAEGSRIYYLTERENIWEGALLFAKKNPIVGYGYSVESKIFADQYKYDIEGTGVDINPQGPLHNGYLSILIGGGLIGLVLFMCAIGIPLYYLFNSKVSSYKAYALSTMAAILISNIVESSITGYFSPTDIFFWIAWVIGGNILTATENN